jgi:hypothetical protein
VYGEFSDDEIQFKGSRKASRMVQVVYNDDETPICHDFISTMVGVFERLCAGQAEHHRDSRR